MRHWGECRLWGWVGAFLSALAIPAPAERLALRTYTTADGLPSSFIQRIVPDSRGLLWFCTRDGLSRFDGSQFVTYSMQHGLPHPTVNHLVETRKGVYWVATNGGGVSRFDPEGRREGEGGARKTGEGNSILFTAFPVGNSPLSNRVNVLYEDRRERLWAGADDGLYRARLENGIPDFHRVALPPEVEAAVTSITEDARDNLWIGTPLGLTKIGPDAHASLQIEWKGPVFAVLADREGRLWVGTTTGLLQFGTDGKQRWYTTRDGLAGNTVKALLQSADGRIWAGGAGLSEFDGKRFIAYTKEQGIVLVRSRGISQDRDGNLWLVATAGAMKLALDGFTAYTVADGLSANRVQSIFEDEKGNVIATGVDAEAFPTISRFDGKRFRELQPELPSEAKAAWPLQGALVDRSGQWWLLTEKGLFRYAALTPEPSRRSQPSAVYDRRRGLAEEGISSLYEDRHGDLWMGSLYGRTNGLTRWVRNRDLLRTYTPADGLSKAPAGASAFAEDDSGRLWVGFQSGGLARRDGDRFRLFGSAEGFSESWVLALHMDRLGRLWIATNQNGLIRGDELSTDRPRFVKYTVREGLASNNVHCITEDRWGRIYAGTARGVDRLDPQTGSVRHYGVNDGLPSDYINGAFCDRNGALWFGTLEGAARLSPQKPAEPARAPPVWIEGVRIAGVRYPLSAIGQQQLVGLILNPDANNIQIDFFSLSFKLGESVRYQFLLNGADREWSSPEAQRTVHYASLSPGSYQFQVRAVNADGAHSAVPAIVSFEILAPFWKRWWFLTLASLAAASMLYTLHRFRLMQLMKVERLRRRMAADLHDDVGASLSRMAVLSELVKQQVGPDQTEPRRRLSDIADTARGLVDSMSDIVWSVDPRLDDLGNVAQRVRQLAADVLDDRSIAWDLHAADGLDRIRLNPEQRRHLYLIFKEGLTNIARHSGSRSVRLSIRMEGGRIRAEIRDHGRGFDPACANGHGLENMRVRAAQVGGTILLKSTIGEGTQISLEMPV